MKNKKLLIIFFLISIIILFFIYRHFTAQNQEESDVVWVQGVKVKETKLPLVVQAIGTLTARSVEITPELAGHVQKIFFHDGEYVKQGAPLIQLDDAIYRAKYQSSLAALTYSENNYKRMVLLGKHGAIAKQAIDQAEADLKEKKAQAQEDEVLLHKMQLIAPFDGAVGKSKINPGDYVTTGQSLVTLTDTKHLHIEYNISDHYLPLVKHGQSIQITTDTYPNKLFSATLVFISPTINIDNRSIALYAELSNEDHHLAPGMFVHVAQILGEEAHALMIPARSLFPTREGEQVYKITNGKAYGVTVLTGKRTDKDVQIVHGISPGEIIITDGQLKVKNGARIKLVGNLS